MNDYLVGPSVSRKPLKANRYLLLLIKMKKLKTHVLIVGGGPTGLSLAAQLIRYNIDFIIVEKNPGTTLLSKALVVQARSLEIFRELGIAKEALAEGKPVMGLVLFKNGKKITAIDISELGKGLSPYPYAFSLEQNKTENLLFDFLAEHQKEVLWNTRMERFEHNESGTMAFCKDKNDNELTIEANYLVGCDGAGSVVRHQLGLNFIGTTEPKIFYVADVVFSSPVINENKLYMFMIPKGFILFFPMHGEGHYRIIGTIPGENFEQTSSFADVAPLISESVKPSLDLKVANWFSTYKVHSRKATSFRKGNCFLAGDAAHIHTPAGGQGMNTGIQDGYNLAWKLAFNLKEKANDELLNSYDLERSENAKHLLATTDRIFDIMSGVNPFWNFIRLNFIPLLMPLIAKNSYIKKQIFPLVSEIGITYPHSFLTIKSSTGKIKSGIRMPYFIFPDGTQIFDYLAFPGFKLLFFGRQTSGPFVQFQGLKIPLKTFAFEYVPKNLFGNEINFYVLLRPDNHISYIGPNAMICKDFLEKLIGR